MKRLIILSAMLAFNAYAGNDVPGNCGQGSGSGNACTGSGGSSSIGVGVGIGGAGGNASAYGGKGGEGGSAAVVGSGNSTVRNESSNSNLGVNEQGQKQSQSASGYGGTSYGQGSGNSTSVNFEGSTYKEAAQTAYAPTPQGPRTSCRLFVGLGGSGRDGSLSGGIPISNDQTCMSGAQIEFMNTVNKIQANTFTVGDYLIAVCAAEGMDKMSACQKK